MGRAVSDPVAFRDIIVVGGGCYGTFYANQLLRARRAGRGCVGAAPDRGPRRRRAGRHASGCAGRGLELRVEEWGAFFDEYLARRRPSDPPDAIVPSPLMPHLMFEWLLRSAQRRWPAREIARRERRRFRAGTPYDVLHADGTRYVSFADWLCPVHCIEPATCPVIRGPRTWEMSDALAELAGRLGRGGPVAGPVLFVCRHRTYGVGMFDVSEVLAGDAAVAAAGAPGAEMDVLVGTVSSCHGAVSLLHLGQRRGSAAGIPGLPIFRHERQTIATKS